MTVIQFPRSHDALARGWESTELQKVIDACAPSVSRGDISGWEVGKTEAGDPQIYLLGPAPEAECVLCVSRLGRQYIVEDGNGQVVIEHDAIMTVAEKVRSALHSKKAAITARAMAAWVAFRETIEDRTEALMAEPMELMTHFAPQLAALV